MSGTIQAKGGPGTVDTANCQEVSGAASGGSIYLRAAAMSLGSGLVTAIAGVTAPASADDNSGTATNGRIELDYGTVTGTTSPTAGYTVTGL